MSRGKPAFTLVEVVSAIGLLAVLALGVISYQFHAVQRSRMAQAKMSATQLGLMVLENWKVRGGSDHYDPATLGLNVGEVAGSSLYLCVVDDIPFYLDLAASDVSSSIETGVTLRELAVTVHWQSDYQQEPPDRDDPSRTFQTYVRRDQSGG